jgi:hypothetical protein
VVDFRVHKPGKSLGISFLLLLGIRLFGFLLLSLDIHFFFGLLSIMLFLRWRKYVVGAMVEIACSFSAVLHRKAKLIYSLIVVSTGGFGDPL